MPPNMRVIEDAFCSFGVAIGVAEQLCIWGYDGIAERGEALDVATNPDYSRELLSGFRGV